MSFRLVLGAGGQAGEAFHRGVVRAMIDLGMDPRRADVIVGTFAGSVVASSLRRHAQPPGSGAVVSTALLRRPHRSSALEVIRRPRQLANVLAIRPEFTSGRQSIEFLRGGPVGKQTAWPSAEFYVVAVRRRDGKRVIFGAPGQPRPDVGAAVAAPFAPGILRADRHRRRGRRRRRLALPTNADVLAGRHQDVVVISSPMSMRPRSASRRLDRPLRLLFHAYLREETSVVRRRKTRPVLVSLPTGKLIGFVTASLRVAYRTFVAAFTAR